MRVPEAMRQAMSAAFYDKRCSVLKRTVSRGDDGGSRTRWTPAGDIMGNLQTAVSKRTIEIYGLDQETEVVITTNPNPPVAEGDRLEYGGQQYTVTSLRHRDSHTLIAAMRAKR